MSTGGGVGSGWFVVGWLRLASSFFLRYASITGCVRVCQRLVDHHITTREAYRNKQESYEEEKLCLNQTNILSVTPPDNKEPDTIRERHVTYAP